MTKTIGFAVIAIGTVCLALAGCATEPGTAPASQPATGPASQPAKELTLDLGNKVTMKLALIPAGKFMMGSPKDEVGRAHNWANPVGVYPETEPQHEVTISKPFYMGVYTVTQEQYQAVIGKNPSWFKGPQNPVEQVTWDDAAEFCRKLSAKTGMNVRLPTEAQWEYACRAGTQTPFNTGKTITPDQANYDGWYLFGDGFDKAPKPVARDKTTPAGSFRPNAWGLYDMHGNVWQWCSDSLKRNLPPDAATDPTGPASGDEDEHVIRGGCWAAHVWTCRSAYREGIPSGGRYSGGGGYFGFRVIVEAG